MRAFCLVVGALAWSAVASADPPADPPADTQAPAPAPAPRLRGPSFGTPRRFNAPQGVGEAAASGNPLLRESPPPTIRADGAQAPAALPAAPIIHPNPVVTSPSPGLVMKATTPAPTPPVVATPAPVAATPAPLSPHPRHHLPKPRNRKPDPPALPAASVKLTVDTPSPDAPWTMRVENTGSVPLRITDDARLLAFDVTVPEAATATTSRHPAKAPTITCELPGEMRPEDDDDRVLVVLPGRSFSEKIDPRLFCFGTRASAALVAGASVVPRLVGARDLPIVEPIEEVEPVVATAREWTGAASVIGAATPVPSKDAAHPRTFTLTTPEFVDVGRAAEAAIPITLRNDTTGSELLLFRPETVAFDVIGPTGIGVTDPSPTARCTWPGPAPSPIRDLFTRLGSHGSTSLSVLPDVLCPDGTLDRPGLYVVRARIDTRKASGESIGLHTFDGEVAAEVTTRLRVRVSSSSPAARLPMPHLDLAPAH